MITAWVGKVTLFEFPGTSAGTIAWGARVARPTLHGVLLTPLLLEPLPLRQRGSCMADSLARSQ